MRWLPTAGDHPANGAAHMRVTFPPQMCVDQDAAQDPLREIKVGGSKDPAGASSQAESEPRGAGVLGAGERA